MLDYAINFYNNYALIFYVILVIAVIFEWPIVILALSLLSLKLWIGFFTILVFAFIWDFFWDLLHYTIGRFFRNKVMKKDFSLIKKIEERLKWHSLIDKLIVIKYTPPLTSLWLLYLWYTKIDFKTFVKNDVILCFFSSIFITGIWYNFWYLFKDQNDFKYLIVLLFISFIIFYIVFRTFTKYLIKKIYE